MAQKYGRAKRGFADRQSWIQIDNTLWTGEVQEPDDNITGEDQKFAQMVHIVNPVPLDAGSITLGDVVIKDGNSAALWDIELDTAKNAGYVQSETLAQDSSITDVTQTPDAVASTKVVQQGGIARTATPTAVANGDAVSLWLDEYGCLVTRGERSPVTTNINAVSIDTTGAAINVERYRNITVHFIASGVGGTETFKIQTSLDNTNWATIVSDTISSDGVVEYAITGQMYVYIRTDISGIGSPAGTYTSKVYAGN